MKGIVINARVESPKRTLSLPILRNEKIKEHVHGFIGYRIDQNDNLEMTSSELPKKRPVVQSCSHSSSIR